MGGERLDVVLEDRNDADRAIAALAPLTDDVPTFEDGTVHAPIRKRTGVIADAVLRLHTAGIGIDDILLRRPTLDDVFIALTGHGAEEEAAEEAKREEVAA